jgi:hypothetical protein
MTNDPIVAEVRRAREAYSKQFKFNLRAIAADLRKKEAAHSDRLVSFPSRPGRRRRPA